MAATHNKTPLVWKQSKQPNFLPYLVCFCLHCDLIWLTFRAHVWFVLMWLLEESSVLNLFLIEASTFDIMPLQYHTSCPAFQALYLPFICFYITLWPPDFRILQINSIWKHWPEAFLNRANEIFHIVLSLSQSHNSLKCLQSCSKSNLQDLNSKFLCYTRDLSRSECNLE